MLADILYVVVMPNTDVRGLRIITESIAGKNESNCESGYEHLHGSVHFGGCVRVRRIQWPRIFRKYFAQFRSFIGHRNHQIGFRAIGRLQFSIDDIPMQSESVFVVLSSGKRSVVEFYFCGSF